MGDISVDLSENIPGDHSDRKTPRGELHWIFTAVTDTIAWNTLPSNVFQKLFREDLLAASLFRYYSIDVTIVSIVIIANIIIASIIFVSIIIFIITIVRLLLSFNVIIHW